MPVCGLDTCLWQIRPSFCLIIWKGKHGKRSGISLFRNRDDPNKIVVALKELYGCFQSYIALQEAFFPEGNRRVRLC